MDNIKTVSIKEQNKSAASSLMKKNIRKFLRNKLAVLGLVIVVVMIIASIMSVVLKLNYSTPDLRNMKVAPGTEGHILEQTQLEGICLRGYYMEAVILFLSVYFLL